MHSRICWKYLGYSSVLLHRSPDELLHLLQSLHLFQEHYQELLDLLRRLSLLQERHESELP